MATPLINPVKREMAARSTVGKHRNKPIIVELDNPDMIRFRVKRTRVRYEVSLHYVYRLAQIMTWEEDFKNRMQQYELKKKAGYKRIRKPRRIMLPLDKATIKAFNQAVR